MLGAVIKILLLSPFIKRFCACFGSLFLLLMCSSESNSESFPTHFHIYWIELCFILDGVVIIVTLAWVYERLGMLSN